MIDVSDKRATKRTAVTHSSITVNETVYKQISSNANTRDNVLNTAQIAGIMTAKNTSTTIPMCHSLLLTDVDVHFNWDETGTPLYTLNAQTTASATDKTGVEMRALTAVSAVALTICNMTEAADKGVIIGETHLESKSDGKFGDFQRQLDQ